MSCSRSCAGKATRWNGCRSRKITRQYLSYLRGAPEIDVDEGAEFFETASWLVLLKSRALLPHSVAEEAPSASRRSPPLPRREEKKPSRPLRLLWCPPCTTCSSPRGGRSNRPAPMRRARAGLRPRRIRAHRGHKRSQRAVRVLRRPRCFSQGLVPGIARRRSADRAAACPPRTCPVRARAPCPVEPVRAGFASTRLPKR